MPSQNVSCGVKLVYFRPLTSSSHLVFWKKIFKSLFVGSSSMSVPNFAQIGWTESVSELKCDLWGQIWLIFYLWNPAAILDFGKNKKFFHNFVCGVNKYVRAKFCLNRMNGICMPSRNVIVGSNLVNFWPLKPGSHLGFWKKSKILSQFCLWSQ